MDFHNKVVIITGASSGIGAATAILFSKLSARVVLVARNEDRLKAVAKKCKEENNIEPLIIVADMSLDDNVKNIVPKTIEAFGKINVLVNNAGVGVRGSILEGIEPFDKAVNTNLRPVYLLTSLVAPHLIETKGNIINVSSVASFGPVKGLDFMPYCISKAGLDQFTKCVALELGPKGVRVNSVNPGGTRTPFVEAIGFSKEQADGIYKSRESVFPLGKVAKSEEVADLIIFLASDRASSITGSVYVIDNGELLV